MDTFDISNSKFYHLGILPQICIHNPIDGEYSKMYLARKKCDCGNEEWRESFMDVIQPTDGYAWEKKRVHRCTKCNEIRMADYISVCDDKENE